MRRGDETYDQILHSESAANHLWVSHAPVMPFIFMFMGIVEGLPPEQWTSDRAVAISLFDYATSFSARVRVGPDDIAGERR